MTFKNFLTEAAGTAHPVGHIEDHVLFGQFPHAHEHLKKIHDRLTGLATTPIKETHHGENVTFGHHPDTGEFFVARSLHGRHITKSSQVDSGSWLHHAFKHLKKVVPKKGVYSGNMLFHEHSKIQDGKNIVFHAGVSHHIPSGHDHFKAIKAAKFGVVVHSKHHGDNVHYSPDLHNFKKHKDVFVHDPEVNVKGRLSTEDSDKVKKHLGTAEMLHLHAPAEAQHAIAPHKHSLKVYSGQTAARGDIPTAVGFKAHLQKAFGHLPKKKLLAHLAHVDSNHEAFENILAQHHALHAAKSIMHAHLNKHPQFLKKDGFGQPIEDHDFISIHNGIASKLVNRSRA